GLTPARARAKVGTRWWHALGSRSSMYQFEGTPGIAAPGPRFAYPCPRNLCKVCRRPEERVRSPSVLERKGFRMHAGKDASHFLLVLTTTLLCCGCFNTPDRRTVAQGDNRSRPRPIAQPDPSADAPVAATRPLHIADQPASPPTAQPTSFAQAPSGTA